MAMRGLRKRRKARARRFLPDTSGNVTILFAVSFICLLAAIGAAADYANVLSVKQQLKVNADASILAAISSAVEAERKGKASNEEGVSKVAAAAKKTARSLWDVNAAALPISPVTPPVISVTKTGNLWAASITYDENIQTLLMGIFGYDKIRVADGSASNSAIGKNKEYWDYTIAVDVSASMGLGATPAAMAAMLADPKIGCSFACHWDPGKKFDTMAYAQSAGYKLRLDVVDDAIDAMIDTMKAAVVDNNISASLDGIENSIKSFVKTTTNLQSVADYNIDMELTPGSKGNTNYHASMAALTGQVGMSGDGTTDKSPKKAVFIVTDGVHDTIAATPNAPNKVTTDHYDGPMDPKFCDKLKENGVKVGVLYIDYYVQSGYGGYISGFKDKMLPNLKDCASPDLFFNATSPEGIKKAMNDMLVATMKASDVRLTN